MTKSTPIDHIRLGAIQAAIWSNDTENGPRFSVTFERMYRDQESQWKYTGNFNRDDLLPLAKVADLAHTRIHEIQGKLRARARAAEEHSSPDENGSPPPANTAGGDPSAASNAADGNRQRARAKAR